MRATTEPTLASLLDSWVRHLRAANLSPRTIQSYTEAAGQFLDHLNRVAHDVPVVGIERAHVEGYITEVLRRHSAPTASNRYRSLQQLFRWLLDEGEIDASPMERMRPPKVPEQPVPVLSDEELRRLLRVCVGRTFDQRRDTAIVTLFIDTGARLSEVANVKTTDVDLEVATLSVLGKGRRHRLLPVGRASVQALDRYLRVRTSHPLTHEEQLWLGSRGTMTPSGLTQVLRRRAKEAGIVGLHLRRLAGSSRHGNPRFCVTAGQRPDASISRSEHGTRAPGRAQGRVRAAESRRGRRSGGSPPPFKSLEMIPI